MKVTFTFDGNPMLKGNCAYKCLCYCSLVRKQQSPAQMLTQCLHFVWQIVYKMYDCNKLIVFSIQSHGQHNLETIICQYLWGSYNDKCMTDQ